MSNPELEETVPTEASLLDLIKQDLDELAQNEDVYIPFIGHERTGLAAKYHLPENGKVLDSIAQKVNRETKDDYFRNLYTSIDTMIALCEGLYVKPYGVEEYIMLDPQDTGMPVKFDDRMAAIVGAPEGSTARNIVKKIFAGNDMAIANHVEKLSRWMMNTKADLTVELWQLGG